VLVFPYHRNQTVLNIADTNNKQLGRLNGGEDVQRGGG
jgi:hypothetical protein